MQHYRAHPFATKLYGEDRIRYAGIFVSSHYVGIAAEFVKRIFNGYWRDDILFTLRHRL